MRALALVVALLFVLAGCRSTYHARAADLAPATAAGAEDATVPAVSEGGKPVTLAVDSIVWTGPADSEGTQAVRAADGRTARNAGWVILGTGLAAGAVLAAMGSMGSDVSTMGPVMGGMLATPFVLVSAPLLTYGYVVGSPER